MKPLSGLFEEFYSRYPTPSALIISYEVVDDLVDYIKSMWFPDSVSKEEIYYSIMHHSCRVLGGVSIEVSYNLKGGWKFV